jgi:tetratricopeptide (TPR) repeat protein
MLAPPAPAPATGIAWSQELAGASGRDDVVVGIAVGEKTLKTRWALKADGGLRRIEDVVLTDPGISLAAASLASLGALPAVRPPFFSRAGTQVVPWLALLAILAIFVAVTAPRVEPQRRRILYLAAAVPAVIVAAGAIVGAVRLVSQPYVLHVETVAPPPGPTDYERGLAARQRGDSRTAKASFEAALAGPQPAPGAARELAAMDLEADRFAEAEQRIASYLLAAGPDPDTLALAAVIQANLGKQREAVESIAAARRLLGPGPKAAELEAKIRARASDAAGAVAALRPLVEKKTITRETLRSDPSYLPIAAAPEWVKFLNEKEAR